MQPPRMLPRAGEAAATAAAAPGSWLLQVVPVTPGLPACSVSRLREPFARRTLLPPPCVTRRLRAPVPCPAEQAAVLELEERERGRAVAVFPLGMACG